ncbi:MAG: tRNA (guanine(26)-N(2))-dimethyltransferase [Acidilobaceae archaeon]|nr:tRNA (guanine(26)-N(2))-dimethyltransferase [Acidilobaceae archaeon]
MSSGLVVTREGKALIYLPEPRGLVSGGRLEPAWMPVFYNPAMEFNRDLSVLVLSSYASLYAPKRPFTVAEPLAATGVRCIRYALESEGVGRVYCGDVDREAYELIEKNVALNGIWHKVSFARRDANALLSDLKGKGVPVLAVDIDPYGSPVPFLDSAINLVGNGGLLMVTATDTAVLEGSKRSKALRRYGCKLQKIPQSKEVAARVLLGYIARAAARYDKWIRPLLSLYVDYYVRVFVLVGRSSSRSLRMVEEELGMLRICKNSLAHFEECEEKDSIGPLWRGDLFDLPLLQDLLARARAQVYLSSQQRIIEILELAREEARLQRFVHQRTDAISSALKARTPKLEEVIGRLREKGYDATPTLFSPTGFRSNAPLSEILSSFLP